MALKCTMILGDCLEVLKELEQDFIFCFADLPYACTHSSWDSAIDLSLFWETLRARLAPTWITVCSATFRFAVTLYTSAPKFFKYDLVFDKLLASGFLHAKRAPLRYHENLLVFGQGASTYNPQRQPRPIVKRGTNWQKGGVHKSWAFKSEARRYEFTDTILPRSVLPVMGESKNRMTHSAQKPVALLDWLIRTYSNPGDYVLDPVSGSGTTAYAALLANRNVTCIERDEGYFEASVDRVEKVIAENNLDVALEVRR